MSYTLTDLIAIERAISSGALHVRFDTGREITYRSLDELLKAKAEIQGALASSAGTPVVRQIRAYTGKGF